MHTVVFHHYPPLNYTLFQSIIHIYIHKGQFGVQFLAQGHFIMQTRGIKPATLTRHWRNLGATVGMLVLDVPQPPHT